MERVNVLKKANWTRGEYLPFGQGGWGWSKHQKKKKDVGNPNGNRGGWLGGFLVFGVCVVWGWEEEFWGGGGGGGGPLGNPSNIFSKGMAALRYKSVYPRRLKRTTKRRREKPVFQNRSRIRSLLIEVLQEEREWKMRKKLKAIPTQISLFEKNARWEEKKW